MLSELAYRNEYLRLVILWHAVNLLGHSVGNITYEKNTYPEIEYVTVSIVYIERTDLYRYPRHEWHDPICHLLYFNY